MASNKSSKTTEEFKKKVVEDDVEFLLPCMTSLGTDNRGCVIPVEACKILLKKGYPFFPYGHYKAEFNEPTSMFVPDIDTYIQLPWRKDTGWLQCNQYLRGQPSPLCPRLKLIELQEKAKSLGFMMKTGLEIEFTLLDKDKHAPIDSRTYPVLEAYHNTCETLKRMDFIKEIVSVMSKQGWEPYMVEHEAVAGQFEINYGYSDALTSGDRLSFFKFMTKELAIKHGCRATFMPYPFSGLLSGNGLHLNISLWDPTGEKNLFPDEKNEHGISTIAQHFMAGILEHAEALAAILCPTTNSYRRLYGNGFASILPPTVCWGPDSHLVMIRLPDSERMEFRTADASANPYLCQAAVLAAGIDGVVKKTALDKGLYIGGNIIKGEDPHFHTLRKVPKSLIESCQYLKKDEVLNEYLGKEFVESYLHVKQLAMDESIKNVPQDEIGVVDDY